MLLSALAYPADDMIYRFVSAGKVDTEGALPTSSMSNYVSSISSIHKSCPVPRVLSSSVVC